MRRRISSIVNFKFKKKGGILLVTIVGLLTIGTVTVLAFIIQKGSMMSPSPNDGGSNANFISGAELRNSENSYLIGTEIKDSHTLTASLKSTDEFIDNNPHPLNVSKNEIVRKAENKSILLPASISNFKMKGKNTPEVILTNGSLALFTKEKGDGWQCNVGDKLIYSFEQYRTGTGSPQTMVIGYVLNGVLYQGKTVQETKGKYEFDIKKNGDYYIYVISATSDYLALKEGTIVHDKQ